MRGVVIGVHGLGNKPPADVLERSWRTALIEGLERNEDRPPALPLDFELVHLADALYAEPVALDDEPYTPAAGTGRLPRYDAGLFDRVVADFLDLGGDLFDAGRHFFAFRQVADRALKATFEDLYRYYTDQDLRRTLQDRVLTALRTHGGRSDRLMLIGHSMGSIVAFDALRRLERSDPRAAVDHFVTIGSPLGLPHVKHRTLLEREPARTPGNVRRWTNFADRLDAIALDVYLHDDYAANDQGVAVRDELVLNGYRSPAGVPNFHKAYGYLRAPEVSAVVRRFL